MEPQHTPQHWDIFCKVIDNFGDIGVCWRLAVQLAQRGQQVRLWVDDVSALQWMAPNGQAGVEVRPWPVEEDALDLTGVTQIDVLIEAFGCEIAPKFISHCVHLTLTSDPKDEKSTPQAPMHPPVWVNLEYLSAERWVERCHALPSPVQQGPAAGWLKWFFYPGFTPATGGLLREPHATAHAPRAWHADPARALPVFLFCYEPPALHEWLDHLHQHGLAGRPVELRVAPGRPQAAVLAHELGRPPMRHGPDRLTVTELPAVPQAGFDALLQDSALNLVRGEDSLVRALWAGQPFVWHIYPQDDDAHHAKLQAFLDWMQAPPSLRHFHEVWNGLRPGPLPEPELAVWGQAVQAARERLMQQDDLVTQLLRFCTEKR